MDMRRPVVLTRNVNTAIKAPFASGVGHRHAPEDLSEGHADTLPQRAGDGGLRGDAVAGGDPPQEALASCC